MNSKKLLIIAGVLNALVLATSISVMVMSIHQFQEAHRMITVEIQQFKERTIDEIKNALPIKGMDYWDGKDGKNGRDGSNVKGDKGDQGDNGNDGQSIQGPKGDKGDPGIDGINGQSPIPRCNLQKKRQEYSYDMITWQYVEDANGNPIACSH